MNGREEVRPDDDTTRFDVPLYTVSHAASIVAVPTSALSTWAKGYVRRGAGRADVIGEPVIAWRPAARAEDSSVPFVGLAEALVLAAVRHSSVPMQRIWPALVHVKREIGVEHALASRKLYTDGAELFFDWGGTDDEKEDLVRHLVVVRNGQRVFADVVRDYLRRIEYDDDGYAALIRVPAYRHAEVVADPMRSFGAPIFERGGARVDDVLQRFWAGESLDELVREFGVPADQLEDVLRVASRRVA